MNNYDKVDVSILIPCKNEELNIERSLKSVRWANEVFVVDSESTDKTIEIAKRFDTEIIQFKYDWRLAKEKKTGHLRIFLFQTIGY